MWEWRFRTTEPPKPATSKPNRRRRVKVKVEAKVEVKTRSLSVLVFLLGLALAAHATDTQPVNSAQLMAWLASGVPSNRLIRLVQERGIASFPDKEQFRQLESAGADAGLILALKRANWKPTPAVSSATEIPALLVQASADAHAQRFHLKMPRSALPSAPCCANRSVGKTPSTRSQSPPS
jgi:hypothetical protein